MNYLTDTHAHLLSSAFDEDREKIILESKKKMKFIVEVGCTSSDISRVLELSKKHNGFIFPSIGIHPNHCEELTNELKETIINTIEKENIIAIGEIGIDLFHFPETLELQKKVFEWQIKIAKKYDLPIIVHCRDAFEECYEILKKYAPINGVIHSFSEDYEKAIKMTTLNLHIGLSGPITFKNGISQRDVAKQIDISKLLIETDSPYMTPVPFRGKRNQPQFVEHIAAAIALEKNMYIDDVIKYTHDNAVSLFLKGINV